MKKEELKFLKNSMLFVPNGGIVVELGSWTGGSSEQLAKGIQSYCPKTFLFCVDPFDEEYFKKTKGLKKKMNKYDGGVYEYFKKRMKPYPHTLIRKLSSEAVKEFKDNTVNYIFIDA